jgi:hypothetical protein
MRKMLVLLVALPALGGEFVNLTFDDPDLSGPLEPVFPGGPLRGSATGIVPGWSFFTDGLPVATATWSAFNFGSGGGHVSLVQNSPANAAGPLGEASLVLQSRIGNTASEIRLSQRGTIPADAAGLWIFGTGHAQVFINGERLGDTVSTPTVDVSRYAGQEVDLEFLVAPGASIRFDILGFVPVPEPSAWALFGVGAAAVLGLARRKH